MGRFVALIRKEEEAIALGAKDCWHPPTVQARTVFHHQMVAPRTLSFRV
jgi:hypothetical protein